MKKISVKIALISLAALLFSGPARGGSDFGLKPLLGERWYGVYLMNNKVGYARALIARNEYQGRDAYLAALDINYKLSLLGQTQQMRMREERIYLPEKGLVSFTFEEDSVLGKTGLRGTRRGDEFEVKTAGETRMVSASPESFRDYLADILLVKEKAPVGTTVSAIQFQPNLLKSIQLTHSVKKIESRFIKGVPTRVYHIQSDFVGLGIQTLSLITENLHTLEATVGNFLTIREEGEMEARDLDYSSDIILLTAITPSRPIADPRRAAALQLKLRGLRDPSLLPVSRRQSGRRAGPDSYYLRIELPEDDPRDSRTIPRPEPDLEPYLKPTLNIQSNHPSIQSLARQIVGTEKNARRVTAKLVNWVYHNLDKSFLAAIPDALRVLEKKAGDCKAHSILFVALARSLGIPARIASGLVYTPDGKFYYHQWAEVYLDRWRAVDPVFGQIQADATHITLSYGELSEQIRLMNLIGQLEIEILDYD